MDIRWYSKRRRSSCDELGIDKQTALTTETIQGAIGTMKCFASPVSKQAERSDENIDKRSEVLKKDQEDFESDWREMVIIGEAHETYPERIIGTLEPFERM